MNIRAPGVDVTIIGDPRQVKSMLAAVKSVMERFHRKRQLEAKQRLGSMAPRITGGRELVLNTDSQIVKPSDLDEMDSPYAIPEHRTVPPGSEPQDPAEPVSQSDASTPVGDIRDTLPAGSVTAPETDEPDREVTKIDFDPSGGVHVPSLERDPHT